MADISAVTRYFPTTLEGFVTSLSSTVAPGATIVPLSSVSTYPDGCVVVLVVDPSDTLKKQVFTGTIDTAGIRVINVKWTEGSNDTHLSGAVVADYVTASDMDMLTTGILKHTNQAGQLVPTTLFDANGNETLKLPATSSAVNEVTITNAATGNAPSVAATGGDTNSSLNLVSKGTGGIQFNGTDVTGAWLSYTPIINQTVLGNGTIDGKYKQIGKTVFFRILMTFGSTSSFVAGTSFRAPLPINTWYVNNKMLFGNAFFRDVSAGGGFVGALTFFGGVLPDDVIPVSFRVSGTIIALDAPASTIPFTWATGDTLYCEGTYETT